jgi:hypothetical protein
MKKPRRLGGDKRPRNSRLVVTEHELAVVRGGDWWPDFDLDTYGNPAASKPDVGT